MIELVTGPTNGSTHTAAGTTPSPDPSRDFEAMVLRPFLDNALPRAESVFGGGTGGDAWRSMLIDALARDWAEHGSLGIAERFLPGGGVAT